MPGHRAPLLTLMIEKDHPDMVASVDPLTEALEARKIRRKMREYAVEQGFGVVGARIEGRADNTIQNPLFLEGRAALPGLAQVFLGLGDPADAEIAHGRFVVQNGIRLAFKRLDCGRQGRVGEKSGQVHLPAYNLAWVHPCGNTGVVEAIDKQRLVNVAEGIAGAS